MNRRAFWIFLFASSVGVYGQKKGKDSKPPEVQLLEASARRQEGIISVDARVKNCGEKPIKALQLILDFVASDHKQVITTKRGGIDAEMLDPGEEAEFHAQLEDQVRATEFQVNFEDGNGKYLRTEKTGPFPIE